MKTKLMKWYIDCNCEELLLYLLGH